ncbi:hypothetical protein [Streptomyces ipomoeae]|uniref:hypothetical protein n=1 Tax=Streptomyces ipomoeae TaxID=103232 RepID=UPI001146C91B|nr:hypothetical protein [Streptomyces ipomoeae]MDX2939024.1 hypothetical protein [Streptomyces ipomoeae]TQE24296.1 hypothetical protein SipoB123_18945 [Streptomyces ipomoeae]
MPSLLHYEIITDPTSLQASLPGEPSVGTVYILVSNNHRATVRWDYIDVELSQFAGTADLTNNPAAITASIDRTRQSPRDDDLQFEWDSNLQLFRAQVDRTQNPAGRTTDLYSQQGLVLKLENIPIAEDAGLAVLEIHETAHGGDAQATQVPQPVTTTLGLVKQTPRVPRNFRAEKSLLDGDQGETLELKWDGPTDLDYAILDPRGAEVTRMPAKQGPSAHGEFVWPANFAPKRGTTYTLIAKAPGGAYQRGYFLTTTVHASIPEFEGGTRTPWIEGTVHKGRAVFARDGVEIQDQNHPALGRLRADKADVDSVITTLVQGRTADAGRISFPDGGVDVQYGQNSTPGVIKAARADVDGVNTTWAGSRDAGKGWIEFSQPGAIVHKDGTQDRGTLSADKVDVNGLNTKWVGDQDDGKGWIDFPDSGIDVFHGPNRDLGVVTANRADLNGVNTKWAGDRDGGRGWIEFPQSGINVRKDGGQEWGTVAADKADLNGINTKWVQGRTAGDGWIEFPAAGLNVFQGAGNRQWGTIAADKADLNDLVTHRAEVKERLTLHGGLTVDNVLETQDGPPRLVVHGGSQFEGRVNANGDLHVDGDSVFLGKVNANGHLSVRNGTDWLMHVNDDQVAIQGNLRVHGAFRSDS